MNGQSHLTADGKENSLFEVQCSGRRRGHGAAPGSSRSTKTTPGLHTLEDLRYLSIAYAPKLRKLDALASGAVGIRAIAFDKARGIQSYQPLATLSHLRRLKLSTCPAMPDLKWTAGMDRLDFFSFVETDVMDGDLSPLLALPRLRYVGTTDKRHYSMKCNALNDVLTARHAPH